MVGGVADHQVAGKTLNPQYPLEHPPCFRDLTLLLEDEAGPALIFFRHERLAFWSPGASPSQPMAIMCRLLRAAFLALVVSSSALLPPAAASGHATLKAAPTPEAAPMPEVAHMPKAAPMWYDSGHRVVAAVAWEGLQPAVRDSVTRLLQQAPSNADLASLMPTSGADRERAFFMHASTWADQVRDETYPDRREAYHRGRWHYTNVFWVQTPDGPLVMAEREPTGEHAAERLKTFIPAVTDDTLPAHERAIQLAWILHLVGDLHQPLHASSQVSREHPEGDRGGGLVPLSGSDTYSTLHTYWDGILDLSYPAAPGESTVEHASRIAERLPSRSAGSRVAQEDSHTTYIGAESIDAWLQESAEVAQLSVYLPVVRAGTEPPALYRRHALRIAREQLRVAGERLAATLNHIWGNESSSDVPAARD